MSKQNVAGQHGNVAETEKKACRQEEKRNPHHYFLPTIIM